MATGTVKIKVLSLELIKSLIIKRTEKIIYNSRPLYSIHNQ